MPQNEQLRANVRAELARAGTTAAAMDRRLGWPRATLSRRLLGNAEFRASDLQAIALELGIPVARFYDGPSSPVAPASATAAAAST